jgi:prepilin-type N-terminal cleavage/methylation domain-containing protein
MDSRNPKTTRSGFTLIEVLLSISLMTIAMTGVNLLITNGLRSSVDSNDRTVGIVIASSITEQILLGNQRGARQGVEHACEEPYAKWSYRWSTQPVADEGLVKLLVSVQRTKEDRDSRVQVDWVQLVGLDQLQQNQVSRSSGSPAGRR